MSYTDQATLIERFDEVELLATADRDGDQVIDSALIARVIADASAEIDAYLRGRYTLPLAEPIDPLIGRLAADIARYQLQDDNPLDEARERFLRAVETLRRIANGQMHLQVPTRRSGLNVATAAAERQFTHETLVEF